MSIHYPRVFAGSDVEAIGVCGRRDRRNPGRVDILVDNAGVAYVDSTESFPMEKFDR
jgi:NADP-dependent 3-hydroxy acid dehydrogenase YdfG